MAREALKLTVSVSPTARHTLDEIWDWNAEQYGVGRADAYIAFLMSETNKLSVSYYKGKAVPSCPSLNYFIIRKSRKGHGHLAVYEVTGSELHILDYYHTAQDWQKALAEKRDRGDTDSDK